MINTVNLTIPKKKTIALIAHDNKKSDMLEWVRVNRDRLAAHTLCGTGTTARLFAEQTALPVLAYNSGPLGGDQQIGAMLANGELDLIIFLRDPLTAQPHEPDVSALMRLGDVQKIPLATNYNSAVLMLEALRNGTFTELVGKK